MRKPKRGVTLVEVMLAGALTSLLVVTLMHGIIIAVDICRENSELLAVEAYAWDTAWKWLNKKGEDLTGSEAVQFYPNANGFLIASNECPVVYRSASVGSPKCFVCVSNCTDEIKCISVDVEWGATGKRYCLNRLASPSVSAGAKSYNVPIRVYRCSIDRGEERE